MDGTGELFAPLLECLPAEVEPIVVRYPDRRASYPEHEAVAQREIPRDRPFVLLGESFSGPVAVAIAARLPPNLRGLILCASFLSSPNRLLRPLRGLAPLASPKLLPGFIAHRALMGSFATPELQAAHARALSHVSSATLTSRLRAMADVDAREQLRGLTLPALYLRGSRDRLVGRRHSEEFRTLARDGVVIDVEGPHFLLQTQPAECARHIRAFIARVG
jgi:pimeloyl-ACP methyl ester carboxylesterase